MHMQPASPDEMETWNSWLTLTHGISGLDKPVYRCELKKPMLLVPWLHFERVQVMLNHRVNQVLVTFRVQDDVHTVAGYRQLSDHAKVRFYAPPQLSELHEALIAAALEGRVWWGIPLGTMRLGHIGYVLQFPSSPILPVEARGRLTSESASPEIEITVDLI
jgi:hypothetical protein